MPSKKAEPWYVPMRAEASANLMFIRIPGIRLEQNKRGKPDLLIFLPDSSGNPTSRLMTVEVKATSHPDFGRDNLPNLSPSTRKQIGTLSADTAVPLCLFYFTVDAEKGEQTWGKWLAKPLDNGKLATGDEAGDFFPLDEPIATNLVNTASQWYEKRRVDTR